MKNLLTGHIHKALRAVSEPEKRAVLGRWVSVRAASWRPGPAFWIAAVVSLAVLAPGAVLFWNRSLQRQVAARTRELQAELAERRQAERESERAREAAEAANRSKDMFLANMSHEIRTPMNGVIGMTELALDTELTTEQRGYIEAVREAGKALLEIINDILDFSKTEAGKLHLDALAFDLSEALATTLKPLWLRANEKGLELAHRIEPGVPEALVGDPGRLQQVLVNLVGNAVKFTKQGAMSVQVAVADKAIRPG